MESEAAKALRETAGSRRYRVQSAKSGKYTLYRLNQFTNEWKMEAREGSTRWNVAMDMIHRGWAVLEK